MTVHPSDHGQDTGTSPRFAETAAGPPEELPLITGHAEMDGAFQRGLAVPVTESIGWLMRYRGAWWVIFEDGWLRVIEGPVADSISRLHPRLAAAEAAAREAADRASRAARGTHAPGGLARDEGA
jgi:hypothetical protein